MVARSDTNATDSNEQLSQASKATIRTCVKMVVDIVHHNKTQGEPMPVPCCVYCFRTARKHAALDDQSIAELKILRALENSPA